MANSNLLKLSQNKANIQQAADSLKQAQRGSSAAATSGTQAAAALPQMAEREVKNESIFASGSASTPPKTSVSGQEFAEALSGKTFAELNQVQKAQYQLLSAFADTDGDNSITKDEVTALDLTEDGVISQEDIDQIYEELGIGTDASVDELLDAIDEILEAKEATEAAKTGSTSPATATGSTAAAAATDAVKPEDIKGINLENSGVVPHVDANGNVTFTVQVEAWGTQADGRQANDCLTRIISNAYPDATAAEKQAIMSQICSMNPQIQDPNVIYTNDTLNLPVVNRDENGQIQFADSTKAQPADEAKDEASHAVPKDSTGHGSLHTDQGTITFEYGKYYLNGEQVNYDEKTGDITYSGKTGTYGKSVSLPDGHSIVPDKGIYYIDGQKINPEDFDNGVYSFTVDGKNYQFNKNTGDCTLATKPQGTEVKHEGSQSGTAVASDGTHVEWFQGKYYVDGQQVRYDESTGKVSDFDTSVHKDSTGHGSGIAADGSKVTFEYGKYYIGGKWVDYNEKTGTYKLHQN